MCQIRFFSGTWLIQILNVFYITFLTIWKYDSNSKDRFVTIFWELHNATCDRQYVSHWQCNSQSVTNKELSPLRSSKSNICTTKVTKTANKITDFRNIHQSAIGHLVSQSVSHQTYAIDWVSDQIHDRGHTATLQELRIRCLTMNKCATIIYYEHSWLFGLYSSCSDMSNPHLPA